MNSTADRCRKKLKLSFVLSGDCLLPFQSTMVLTKGHIFPTAPFLLHAQHLRWCCFSQRTNMVVGTQTGLHTYKFLMLVSPRMAILNTSWAQFAASCTVW